MNRRLRQTSSPDNFAAYVDDRAPAGNTYSFPRAANDQHPVNISLVTMKPSIDDAPGRRTEELFTTAEVATLAEAPPSAVEKAIEEGIVEVRKARAPTAGSRPRRLLSTDGIYYVAFLRRCDVHFSKAHKERLWSCLKATPSESLLTARWNLSPGIEIRPGELLARIRERVTRYIRARHRWIEVNPDIKGGTPVIRGTRLSVYSVSGRIDHGDSIEDVLEDNPDLPRDAIEAALGYARANPLVGRPGGRPWQA